MSENRSEVLLHPVRIRIAQAAAGRHVTTKDLAAELSDVPVSSIYRHVGQLVDAGFLEVVGSRQVRGTTERTFTLNTVGSALEPDEVAFATPDDHLRYFTAFVGSLLEQGTRYLTSPGADPIKDGFSYRFTPIWLSDTELEELRNHLFELFTAHMEPGDDPARRRRVLSNILIPDPSEEARAQGEVQ